MEPSSDLPHIPTTIELPFFCGVDMNRLAGERESKDIDDVTRDPNALTLIYDYNTSATNIAVYPAEPFVDLVYVPLADIMKQEGVHKETLTFLGLQNNLPGKPPVFAILCDNPVPKSEWREILSTCSKKQFSRENGAIAAYGKNFIRQHSKKGLLFCPQCGTKTVSQGAGTKRFCPQCQTEFFSRTDPVALVLVEHPTEDKILLVGKARYKPATRHTCVAGFIEPGESAEEGAIREVMEETSIVVDPTSVQFVCSQPWCANIGSQLMIGFRSKALTTEIKLDTSELSSGRWVSAEEVRRAIKREDMKEGEITLPADMALATTVIKTWLNSLDNKKV